MTLWNECGVFSVESAIKIDIGGLRSVIWIVIKVNGIIE